MPDYDSGFHMASAYIYHQALASGNVLLPFTSYDSYPPLVHLLGALTIFVTGMHPMALILSSDVVFVPMLAFGCYGVGKIVAGRRAGLLAGIFALGTPMIVSMMHLYDLDPPQAATVAVALWAILATRRFEVLNRSLLAGLLFGLALMTKQTSAVFLGGLVASVIVRGGWRNWRGLIIFALVVTDSAGIWYALHFHQLSHTLTTIGGLQISSVQTPPRWSLASFGWYFWDLVNEQVLAPFAVALAIGCFVALVRSVRGRAARGGYIPDLLIGAVSSYVGMTLLTHKDPRYTLPMLVYVAVLATFWIPGIARRPLRVTAYTAVLAVAAVNFVGMSFGVGGIAARVMVALPGAETSIIYPGHLTVYEDVGWVRGGPEHNGDAVSLLAGLHRAGVKSLAIDPDVDQVDYSIAGLLPLADAEQIAVVAQGADTTHSRYLLLHRVRQGDPAPCQSFRATDTVLEQDPGYRLGVYVVDGTGAGVDARTLRDAAGRPLTLACPSG
jgi:4-amino-4-deoxy-L-arabinose transferase-like glycosyltransferase